MKVYMFIKLLFYHKTLHFLLRNLCKYIAMTHKAFWVIKIDLQIWCTVLSVDHPVSCGVLLVGLCHLHHTTWPACIQYIFAQTITSLPWNCMYTTSSSPKQPTSSHTQLLSRRFDWYWLDWHWVSYVWWHRATLNHTQYDCVVMLPLLYSFDCKQQDFNPQ